MAKLQVEYLHVLVRYGYDHLTFLYLHRPTLEGDNSSALPSVSPTPSASSATAMGNNNHSSRSKSVQPSGQPAAVGPSIEERLRKLIEDKARAEEARQGRKTNNNSSSSRLKAKSPLPPPNSGSSNSGHNSSNMEFMLPQASTAVHQQQQMASKVKQCHFD